MRLSRKQQFVWILLSGFLFLFAGCASAPRRGLSADAQAKAMAHFSLGLLAEAGGESCAALGHFEEALRLDPGEETLYAPAVALALKLDKRDDGIRLALEQVRRFPGMPEPRLLLARVYAVTEQPARAERLFRRVIRKFPNHPDAPILLAQLYLSLDRVDEAVDVLRAASGQQSQNAELLHLLGLLLLQTERHAEAYEALDRVYKKSPDTTWLEEPLFLFHLLIAALESGRTEEAASVLAVTYARRPSVFDQHIHALLTGQTPVSRKAATDLLKAFHSLTPEAPEPLYYLMLLQTHEKDYESAIKTSRQFRDLAQRAGKPELLDGSFYYQAASMHERTGQLDEAEILFYKAIGTGCETITAASQNYIAYMWAERGEKLNTGLELIKAALEAEPENGAFLDTLGWIYYMKGRYEEALETLKKALPFVEDDPVVWEHLGDTYMKLGNRESAMQHWKKALELDPGSDRLVERINRTGTEQ